MSFAQKITVVVDSELLLEARQVSGLGLTEVVREGLRAVVATRATHALRAWRGKAKLNLDVRALRDDG